MMDWDLTRAITREGGHLLERVTGVRHFWVPFFELSLGRDFQIFRPH